MNFNRDLLVIWIRLLLTWPTAIYLALYFRFETNIPSIILNELLTLNFSMIMFFIALTYIDRIIFGRAEKSTFEEFFSLTRIFVLTGVLFTGINFIDGESVLPRSIPILSSILGLGIYLAQNKFLKFKNQQSTFKSRRIPVAIYGAGEQGSALIQKMLNDPNSSWYPRVLIDDFIDKSVNKINGIKIESGLDFESTLKKYKINILIVSFSRISNSKLQELHKICDKLNIEFLIIPPINAITGKDFSISDIRVPSQEELIGKSSITINTASVRRLIQGKKVLITGAGGSIGSELARQISSYSPGSLYLLDRDESALLAVNLSLSNQGSLDQEFLVLADIRDKESLELAFEKIKPEIVFHTAALKHLSMLESFPLEAIKTNIIGTANLLTESIKHEVLIFVNISTDKAADPISNLGRSKMISEQLTTAAGEINGSSRFFSVRFGNVFASRGSVLHTFNKQIEAGGPITITAKGVSRFFMTIEDAVHLVLRAATTAQTGETMILNMGEPILIESIARKLIESSGKDISIEFGELRKGEKLSEQLIGNHEQIIQSLDSEIVVIRSLPSELDLYNLKVSNFKTIIN